MGCDFWNEVLVHERVTESMPVGVFGLRATIVLPILNDVFENTFRLPANLGWALSTNRGWALSTNRGLAILRGGVLQPGILSEPPSE